MLMTLLFKNMKYVLQLCELLDWYMKGHSGQFLVGFSMTRSIPLLNSTQHLPGNKTNGKYEFYIQKAIDTAFSFFWSL